MAQLHPKHTNAYSLLPPLDTKELQVVETLWARTSEPLRSGHPRLYHHFRDKGYWDKPRDGTIMADGFGRTRLRL